MRVIKATLMVLIIFSLFSFVYASEGAISGVVTDSITGNPIPNARVNARRINGHGCGMAVTDENGYYLISNLAPGPYTVTCHAQNYYPKHYPNPVEVVAGQTVTDINFALKPYTSPPQERGSISGRVTDSITGNPIANARVNACGPSCGQAITNENGEYIIENLIPGEYRVNASALNYFSKRYPQMVNVYPNQNTPNIDFQLIPRLMPPPRGTGSISGVVLDSLTNQPIANAQVVAMFHIGRRLRIIGRATTNENGEYIIENLPTGDYIVIARAFNYYPKRYPQLVHVENGQNTPNINFLLIPRSQEHRYRQEIENRIRERILRR
ncbi:MAG: carboxypeptidase-like regulatory domain-containing protein [candidate division WOR-3 bacterium]|nr:carboxypeptidase-like regulatory domain-containing protein [candidate division WOR-3 bacterium]MDW8113608.1 carboxypeptidase-like regulatory domain-containing protein [candidate division WOR-3 bacterium]